MRRNDEVSTQLLAAILKIYQCAHWRGSGQLRTGRGGADDRPPPDDLSKHASWRLELKTADRPGYVLEKARRSFFDPSKFR